MILPADPPPPLPTVVRPHRVELWVNITSSEEPDLSKLTHIPLANYMKLVDKHCERKILHQMRNGFADKRLNEILAYRKEIRVKTGCHPEDYDHEEGPAARPPVITSLKAYTELAACQVICASLFLWASHPAPSSHVRLPDPYLPRRQARSVEAPTRKAPRYGGGSRAAVWAVASCLA